VGDPGHREGADRTAGERRGERGHVLVLHRLALVPTATPAAWPTATPSGTGRSFTAVRNVVPATDATGPQQNSPRSTRWLPMSASAPEPAPPR
jgi:hypothetical protein